MQNIKGSVALVTGANRGLGNALVQELLDKGAAKIYATSRKPHDFKDARIVNISLDVKDAASIKELAALAPDANIVINNAGVFVNPVALAAEIDSVRNEFEINVFGPLQVTQTMASVLNANGGGTLVNVVSVGSWLPLGTYGGSKAALWAITNMLRQELKAQGTTVMSVHMGPMDTDMVRGLDVPKEDPKKIACAIVGGIERGDSEVLADQLSTYTKGLLSGPIDQVVLPAS